MTLTSLASVSSLASLLLLAAAAAGCRSSAAPMPMPASEDAPKVSSAEAPRAAAGMYPKPSEAVLREKLTPLQFEVTQHEQTEPPFRNAYWDNHEAGIYVDVATGEPLFSSADKFESGTGWPSFIRPIEDGHIASQTDLAHGMVRNEVRSTSGGSHLGHLFDDGPPPTGMRYCINSASLRFVPVARLEAEGYGAYASRFRKGAAVDALPAATQNACATPPPGEKAGCATTLETAELPSSGTNADALLRLPGVLEVERGVNGGKSVRVLYDPKVVTESSVRAAAATH